MDISELLKPLTPTEKLSYSTAIKRLLDNPDFVLYIRDCFEKANPLSGAFSTRKQNDPSAAAKSDGEKAFTRYLLKMVIEKDSPLTEKPTIQTEVDIYAL